VSPSGTERARSLARTEAKTRAARFFARALAVTGSTQTAVAAACSVARSKAHRWSDPDAGEVPTLADLQLMPREVALELLRELADELGGVALVELPLSTQTPCDDLTAGAAALERSAAACVAWSRANADGVVDAQEGAEVDDAASEAIAHLLRIRERARYAMRRVVLPLRRAVAR